jgi:hypothetical protein
MGLNGRGDHGSNEIPANPEIMQLRQTIQRAMGLRSAGPPHPQAKSRRPRLRLTAMAAAYVSMRTMMASPA